MDAGTWAAIAYGFLAILGGAIGYAQARSKVSLISGVASGLLLIIGASLYFGGFGIGLVLAAIVTGVLMVVFAVRLFKTRKFMPAGLMIIAGAIALFLILQSLL